MTSREIFAAIERKQHEREKERQNEEQVSERERERGKGIKPSRGAQSRQPITGTEPKGQEEIMRIESQPQPFIRMPTNTSHLK